MNKKVVLVGLMVLALIFCLSQEAFSAHGYAGKSGYGCHMGSKGGYSHKKGMESKFTRKAHFFLKNKEELDLTDKQVATIKNLKLSVKKDLIKRDAEIEILALDIKAKMWEDTINTTEINKLIDKKYDLKKEKAKALVAACAKLKGVLTDKQKDKLKGLCKQRKQHKAKRQ